MVQNRMPLAPAIVFDPTIWTPIATAIAAALLVSSFRGRSRIAHHTNQAMPDELRQLIKTCHTKTTPTRVTRLSFRETWTICPSLGKSTIVLNLRIVNERRR